MIEVLTQNNLKPLHSTLAFSVDYIIGNEEPKKKIPKDLKKLLDEEEIALNGRLMTAEDKEKLKRIIEAAYWDAKEMNKHKRTDCIWFVTSL